MVEATSANIATDEDIESGGGGGQGSGGGRRNNNNGDDDMEAIPSMDNYNVETGGNNNNTAAPSSSTSTSRSNNTNTNNNTMTTMLRLMFRQHIQSRTPDNPNVQAILERLFLFVLFFSGFVEGSVNYLLGNSSTSNSSNNNNATSEPTNTIPPIPPPQPSLVTRGYVPNVPQLGGHTGIGYLYSQPLAQLQAGTSSTSSNNASSSNNHSKCPIICIHSTGRSSDEFFEVLPLLAADRRRVIAIDIPGYGISPPLPQALNTRDRNYYYSTIATAIVAVANHLLIDKFVLVGSLELGYIVTMYIASMYPQRVLGIIVANPLVPLSNIKTTTTTTLKKKEQQDEDDDVPEIQVEEDNKKDKPQPQPFYQKDGSHLIQLHHQSLQFGKLHPELHLRVVHTQLIHRINTGGGNNNNNNNNTLSTSALESWIKNVTCPHILCLKGEEALNNMDNTNNELHHGTKRFEQACQLLTGGNKNRKNRIEPKIVTLSGPQSTIYMINQAYEEFASMCLSFLNKNHL